MCDEKREERMNMNKERNDIKDFALRFLVMVFRRNMGLGVVCGLWTRLGGWLQDQIRMHDEFEMRDAVLFSPVVHIYIFWFFFFSFLKIELIE